MGKIPNDDYLNWDDHLPNWPQVDGEINVYEWLEWYEEWQDWAGNKLNDGDRLLIEMSACGATKEEIISKFNATTKFGMTEKQFGGSFQYLFDSAVRFGKYKAKQLSQKPKSEDPDMSGFAVSTGAIICSSRLDSDDEDDAMTDEEIAEFFKSRKAKESLV